MTTRGNLKQTVLFQIFFLRFNNVNEHVFNLFSLHKFQFFHYFFNVCLFITKVIIVRETSANRTNR